MNICMHLSCHIYLPAYIIYCSGSNAPKLKEHWMTRFGTHITQRHKFSGESPNKGSNLRSGSSPPLPEQVEKAIRECLDTLASVVSADESGPSPLHSSDPLTSTAGNTANAQAAAVAAVAATLDPSDVSIHIMGKGVPLFSLDRGAVKRIVVDGNYSVLRQYLP